MKEKGTYVEVTTKIGAQTLDDLFEELKKQLNVEEVVFSSRILGSISLEVFGEGVGETVLFSGEDVSTGKEVAVLVDKKGVFQNLKEASAALTPANGNIQ